MNRWTKTDPSLLGALARAESADKIWEEFYHRYRGPLMQYALKLGCTETDAEDAVQETFILFAGLSRDFKYDRNALFRNYLMTLVHRAVLKRLRRKSRKVTQSFPDVGELGPVDESTPRDDCETQEMLEWLSILYASAAEQMFERTAVAQETREIFLALVVEHRTAEEVARMYGRKKPEVQRIRSRYFALFRQSFQTLAMDAGVDSEVIRGFVGK